jgi:hypothetical protein
MPIQTSGQVGPQTLADGSPLGSFRQGRGGEVVVQELHGRFYEQNFRGAVFSDGLAVVTAITAATYNIATLGATCTPIAGLWNPATSTVNAVLLSATLNTIKTALQNTGCGPFFWATSVGNAALTLGSTPLNRKTLAASGSFCKGMSNVALTGLTNNLTVKGASALFGGSSSLAAFLETQAGMATFHTASRELFDGDWIIPPGGVIALLAGSAPVAVSATSMLVWEEVPV